MDEEVENSSLMNRQVETDEKVVELEVWWWKLCRAAQKLLPLHQHLLGVVREDASGNTQDLQLQFQTALSLHWIHLELRICRCDLALSFSYQDLLSLCWFRVAWDNLCVRFPFFFSAGGGGDCGCNCVCCAALCRCAQNADVSRCSTAPLIQLTSHPTPPPSHPFSFPSFSSFSCVFSSRVCSLQPRSHITVMPSVICLFFSALSLQ